MKRPPFCLFCTLCARKETYVLYLHQDSTVLISIRTAGPTKSQMNPGENRRHAGPQCPSETLAEFSP